jgi:formylglycine-generating enzyme required for sulfatase activity
MYVGNFPKGAGPYGALNMSGNADEWTSSWYNPYPGSDLKRENHGQKEKVIKGGSYLKPFRMFSRTAERSSQDPNYGHRSLGFRCAK